MHDPTRRFSNRVEHYIKYRPSYPPAIVDLLWNRCALPETPAIADIGSGTGLLSELFLKRGARVFGIEPNREMREAGEAILADYGNFMSVEGAAEDTTLPDTSVDMVTAAQAYHWFDPPRARAEFERIVRPGGYVALIWNIRNVGASPFMTAYEQLLREFGTDYEQVSHHGVYPAEMDSFFGEGKYTLDLLDNEQIFDYTGLEGRLLSSSYVPAAGEPNCEEMLAALRRLFDEYAEGGEARFVYGTKVYCGQVVGDGAGLAF